MKRLVGVLSFAFACAFVGGVALADDVAAPGWVASESFAFDALRGGSVSDPIDTAEIAAQVRALEGQHEAAIARPAAVAEREDSVDAFTDLGASASIDLIADVFAEPLGVLTSLSTDSLLSSESAPSFVADSDFSARVDPPGAEDSALVVSNVPLRNEDGDVPSGELTAVQGGFAPDAPLANVELPAEADGSVELSDVGVSFEFEGASGTTGRLVDAGSSADRMVFFPNTQTDTDTAVTYTLNGVETFNYLRSADSPESLSLSYELPAGASLEASSDGGAVVVDDAGEVLVSIYPPYAVDAQGTDVPMSLSVDGTSVVLDVPHRGEDFAYPIMVDPVQHMRDWWNNGSAPGFEGWTFQQSGTTQYNSSKTCPSTLATVDPCGSTGDGLYVSAVPTRTYPADSKAYWRWTVPGGSRSSISEVMIDSWRYRKGNSNPGVAFYNLWDSPAGHTFTDGGGGGNLKLVGANSGVKYFQMGLATATANTIPTGASNWRYARLAAYTAKLTDIGAPTLDLDGEPTTWLGPNKTFTITATAADDGLGLKSIQTQIGGTWQNKWSHGCSGTYPTPCPNTSTTQAITYNTNDLPNGDNSVLVKAIDVVGGSGHETVTPFKAKVDKQVPQVTFAPSEIGDGDYVKQDEYILDVRATDSHSGVTKLTLYIDGTARDQVVQSCFSGGCVFNEELTVDLAQASKGDHVIRVSAQDGVSLIGEKSFTVHVDTDDPTVEVDSELFGDELNSPTEPTYPIHIQALDSGVGSSGIAKVEVLVNDVTLFSSLKSCGANCPASTIDSTSYLTATWGNDRQNLYVVVYDRAGNVAQKSVSLNQHGLELTQPECSSNPATATDPSPETSTTIMNTINSDFPAMIAPTSNPVAPIDPDFSTITYDPRLEETGPDEFAFGDVMSEGGIGVGNEPTVETGDLVCLSPAEVGDNQGTPVLVESNSNVDPRVEAAVVPNTDVDVDTIYRPTILGSTVGTLIRSDAAKSDFEFDMQIPDEAEALETTDGRVVIATEDPNSEFDSIPDQYRERVINAVPDPGEVPEGIGELDDVPDVGAQKANADWQMSSAAEHVPDKLVLGVISAPEAIDSTGSKLDTSLSLSGGKITMHVDHDDPLVSYPVLARTSVDTALSGYAMPSGPGFAARMKTPPGVGWCRTQANIPEMVYRKYPPEVSPLRSYRVVKKVRQIKWSGNMECHNGYVAIMRVTGHLQKKSKCWGAATCWNDKDSREKTVKNDTERVAIGNLVGCKKPWTAEGGYRYYRTMIEGAAEFTCPATARCRINQNIVSRETPTSCSN